MSEFSQRTYEPPGPVAEAFLRSEEPVRALMGPIGSGKTNLLFFDGLAQAARMPPCRDGIKYFRDVVVRDTYANMWKTLIPSWWAWFPKNIGDWSGGEGRQAQHRLAFGPPGGKIDVIYEIWFLALQEDRVENVLRGIEFTRGFINEADLVDEGVLPYMLGRVLQRRFPAARDFDNRFLTRTPTGEMLPTYRVGLVADFNPPDVDNYLYKLFEEEKPPGHQLFKQPSGRSPRGENRRGISGAAYEDIARLNAHRPDYVRRMVDGEYGYSRDGQPVYSEFVDSEHVAAEPLKPIRDVGLRLGFDQGVTGPAMVIGQWTYQGQLRILDELVPGHMGPTTFAERCQILLNQKYAKVPIIAATVDPQGLRGGDAEGGDLAWAETLSKKLRQPINPAPTNELSPRHDVIKQLLSRRIDGREPALLLSPTCRHLRKGFNSHYRYKLRRTGASFQVEAKPDKNWWSNPHDALQYLALDIFGLDGVTQGEAAHGPRRKPHIPRPDDDDDDDEPREIKNRTEFDVYKC